MGSRPGDGPVLVTGGAGFIGSHVVEALLRAGEQVVVVDNLSRGLRENLPPGVVFVELDLLDPEVEALLREYRPRCVVHQAAQVDVGLSVAGPEEDARVNIMGSLRLLHLAARYGVRKVVFASSAAVYGEPRCLPLAEDHPAEPLSPYGVGKLAVEHYLRVFRHLYGLDFTVLRYANVYGPRQRADGEGGVVAIFADRLLRGEVPTIFGDGEQVRDFVYVEDVARANLLALRAAAGQVLNVSSGEGTPVNRLFALVAREVGRPLAPRYGPRRPGDLRASVLSPARAAASLGWHPTTPLAEGIRRTVAAFRAAAAASRGGGGAAERWSDGGVQPDGIF